MINQINLIEIFFGISSFVIYIFLYLFFKKLNKKIDFIKVIMLDSGKNLNNKPILDEKFNRIEEKLLDLKSLYSYMNDCLISNNSTINRNSDYLIKEIIKFQNLGKENYKLLHIINRKIHNKPKIDNVQ